LRADELKSVPSQGLLKNPFKFIKYKALIISFNSQKNMKKSLITISGKRGDIVNSQTIYDYFEG